jgi:DNA-binding YbaB/EbfC family protein
MLDMNSMMGKIQEAQQKLKEAQDNLVNLTAEGEAGAGMVKATVNGKRQVLSVDFDSSLLSEQDKAMLQDLTVAAINKAIENIEPKIKDAMSNATSGMMPNIPGMDLGNMMNF